MPVGLEVDEPVRLAQRLDDLRVGIEDRQALEQRRSGDKAAVAADRIVDRQPVAPAQFVVVCAMAGRRVHRAGAGVERHVLAEDDGHLAFVERVLEAQPLERPARGLAEHAMGGRANALGEGLQQRFGHDQPVGS